MKAMQTKTCEQIVTTIAEHGKDKVTTVSLSVSVNVNNNGVSKPSYYIRAYRSSGPDTQLCAATAYNLDELEVLMLQSLDKYPSPETDKQREIAELESKLAKLKE